MVRQLAKDPHLRNLTQISETNDWPPAFYEDTAFALGLNFEKTLDFICKINMQRFIHEERRNQFEYFMINGGKGDSRLIEEILDANKIDYAEFATAIKEVLSLEHNKISVLFLTGNPNSCKSLIERLITKVFRCAVILKNSETSSEFWWESLINASICTVDEPFLHALMLEDFKAITSGTELSVSKKWSNKQKTKRIPFIVTSNFEEMCRGFASKKSEIAARTRMRIFKFYASYEPKKKIESGDLVSFIKKHVKYNRLIKYS